MSIKYLTHMLFVFLEVLFIATMLLIPAVRAEDAAFRLEALEPVVLAKLQERITAGELRVDSIRAKEAGSALSYPLVKFRQDYPEQEFVLSGLEVSHTGRRFEGEVISGDILLEVRGEYEEMVELPVLNRTMQRHDIIAEDDVDWVQVPVSSLHRQPADDLDSIVGKQLKRRMAAGKPIYQRYVTDPMLVEKGEMVSVLYNKGPIHIKTRAYALEPGAAQDVIRVKNPQSGKVITARVHKRGEVVVQPLTPRERGGKYDG